MEDDLWWRTTFDWRRPLTKDDLWWKRTFDGRRPLMEDILMEDTLLWRTTFDGGHLWRMMIFDRRRIWCFSVRRSVSCAEMLVNNNRASGISYSLFFKPETFFSFWLFLSLQILSYTSPKRGMYLVLEYFLAPKFVDPFQYSSFEIFVDQYQ